MRLYIIMFRSGVDNNLVQVQTLGSRNLGSCVDVNGVNYWDPEWARNYP